LSDFVPAGDEEPGSGDDQPCGEHFISKDMECHEGGGAEGITEMDLLLIHDQARLQHADNPEQIQGLTDAWNAAKYAVGKNPEVFDDPGKTEEFALLLSALIEPRNSKGYRRVPVTFGPGKPPAVDPEMVPRAMESLWMAFSEQLADPDEWYHEFEKIHPLEDGNGRLGDIMWKIAKVRQGEEWPTTHPPDFFGSDKSEYTAALVTAEGFITDIGAASKRNTDFRRVLWTGPNMQLVLMSLRPGEEIGEEVHDLSQFLRIEAGSGRAVLDGENHDLEEESAVIVPEGMKHNIINTGDVDLKLYSIYSPPNHPEGTIHETKEEADEAEAEEKD
jgi:mannose-6-phosphate isomerase-like protein (cupin superfamily)